MGYTHYWYRPEKIPKKIYNKILQDVGKLFMLFDERGLKLANWEGKGLPDLLDLSFNGVTNCGHEKKNLGITWPSSKEPVKEHVGPTILTVLKEQLGAENVMGPPDDEIESEGYPKWFAGALLKQRECGGNCSHESFCFPIYQKRIDCVDENDKLVFNCCKTAFKPYDLAVTSVLIIIDHHCPEFRVSSDGNEEHWEDAKMVCTEWLGYGANFKLRE